MRLRPLMLAIAIATSGVVTSAEAGFSSGAHASASHSSFSSARSSFSAPSRSSYSSYSSRPSTSFSSSSSSAGKTNPALANSIRQQKAASPTSTPSTAQPQKTGSNTGKLIAAGVAGAAVGAVATHALASDHSAHPANGSYYNSQPQERVVTQPVPVIIQQSTDAGQLATQQVAQPQQVVQQQPVAQQQNNSSGGFLSFIWSLFKMLLTIIIIAVIAAFAYRYYKNNKSKVDSTIKSTKTKLEKSVDAFKTPSTDFLPFNTFIDIQRAFSDGRKETLYTLVTQDLYHLVDSISGPTPYNVSNITHEIKEQTATTVSVLYKFLDNGSQLEQLWHFTLSNGKWLLEGFEDI